MPPGFKRSRALWDEARDGGIPAWVRAICYELQPIRLSKSNRKQALATLQTLAQNILSLILGIPHVCKSIIIFVANRSLRQWMVVGAVLIYYYFIRWVHEYVLYDLSLSSNSFLYSIPYIEFIQSSLNGVNFCLSE